MLRRARLLARNGRGSAIIEFAIVAPVMCLFIVAAMDLAHTLYMQSALEGAVQKAARDSALETGVGRNADGALDAKVETLIHELARNAVVTTTRRYYRTFSKASQALEEPYDDTNKDHTCNNGEPYQDMNNNNGWDDDGADDGQGGAKDRVLYTVAISYPRIVPLFNFIGVPSTVSMNAKTILENQPYGEQAVYDTPTWRNCV